MQSTARLAVFFCKNFPEVVRQARRQEPLTLETACDFLDGAMDGSGDKAVTVMPKQSSDIVDHKIANGYTVTGYMRLSDFLGFVSFDDVIESFVAHAANEKILGEVFPKDPSN